MSRVLPSRPALARTLPAAGLAVGLALGLSACGDGLRAQTYQERATADATNEAIGALAVRNLSIVPPKGAAEFPAGGSARATFVLVNEGAQADRLTAVSSDAAASVSVAGPDGRPALLSVPSQGTLSGYSFVLRGLTAPLRPGQFVKMSLTFGVNGTEEMLVPVAVTQSPAPVSTYKLDETDSTGKAITETGGGLDTSSEPKGDVNGGESAATPPPAR